MPMYAELTHLQGQEFSCIGVQASQANYITEQIPNGQSCRSPVSSSCWRAAPPILWYCRPPCPSRLLSSNRPLWPDSPSALSGICGPSGRRSSTPSCPCTICCSNQCERNTLVMHHKDNNLKDIKVVQHQIVLLLDQVIRCGQQSRMLNLLPRRLEPYICIHSRKCSTHPEYFFSIYYHWWYTSVSLAL